MRSWHLGVLFATEGKIEHEMDRRFGAVSAVMWLLYQTVLKERAELGTSELPSSACCHCDLALDKWKKMDGWVDGYNTENEIQVFPKDLSPDYDPVFGENYL